MVKRRLCVTVSPRLKRREGLVAVVPLSESAPDPVELWHYRVDLQVPLPWGDGPRWAKCDMIATVGFHRLDRPYIKTRTGGRQYQQMRLAAADISAIIERVKAGLGITD
jgi:mRNA interferase MazF